MSTHIKNVVRQINQNISEQLDSKHVISFITPGGLVGQQTLIANLALMYGTADKKTLIIDTDFSRDIFPSVFNLSAKYGLADYIGKPSMALSDVIQDLPGRNVSFISSGNTSGDDVKYLLGDPRFSELIEHVKTQYTYVLINTPTFVGDIGFLDSICNLSEGIILVLQLRKVPKKSVYKLMETVKRNSNQKILGYVNLED
ncbi:tyrosine-protein kinase family protein [Lactiplantibacillus pentosus]|uniref:AAA family ATPase n=1 Tax=Lactiplantibacillus pentosus TaxID=1589 RepID=A0AAW8VZ28_LACPE|nr:AAA family ATPase [Lactiplantibacillus pentosus]MBO9166194.1 AAA family ATPase [Lactiplantibacillus pentosus]MBU7474986.1 AAA family ATPase [Lactiplantibacillus pentosus]MBU7530283.1 AAA family ATPase [Lactiplantibacillus pentosus]MCE6030997.1 AAA family ATPase [Lactiplantibacillus pentosus]MCT3277069.1 tyrosine-protein kinase family protein [Lactiplantibacillus pentosus]